MYKGVFIDLDGTLLRDDHSISEQTRQTLQTLVQNNILVALVSARPLHGITPISSWLALNSCPLVSLNGAYIQIDNKIVFQSNIDLETISGLHSAARQLDVTLIYYSGLKWYAEIYNDAIEKEQRITEVKVIIAPFEELMEQWILEGTSPNKVMAIGNALVIESLQSKLVLIYKKDMNIYTSKPTYLEVMRHDASKTNAVKYLLDKFAISREQAIAIGDNYNDKEMIMYAGLGVAMGNAPDPIKAIADYVTDSNEHDGVCKAIEKFVGFEV